MAQIITSFFSQRNTLSQNSNISVNARKYPVKQIPYDDFRHLKREQHKVINDVISELALKPAIAMTLRELLNHADATGHTRISYSSLAKKLFCCVRTIGRYITKLADMGLISKVKNGWKQTNTVTLLVVQSVNINKEDKMSCDLNKTNLQDLSTKHLLDEREKLLSKPDKIPPQCNSPNQIKVDFDKIVEENLAPLPQGLASMVKEKLKWALNTRKIISPIAYLRKIIESIQTKSRETNEMKTENMHNNWVDSNERAEKANQMAKEQLKAQGCIDPMLDMKITPEERYVAGMAYRERLASLSVQLQREMANPNPRPVIEYPPREGTQPTPKPNIEPKRMKSFARSYYDD